MKNQKYYNLFILLSTFSRNIIDIYSVVYLYQKFNNVKDIIIIYLLVYFCGIFISTITLYVGSRWGYKYPLLFSQIITGWSFYLNMESTNILLIAICLSLSIFTYHPIRHYYGINLLKNKASIGLSLIINYLGVLISSVFVIRKLNLVYLIIISIIGVIPVICIKNEGRNKIVYPRKIVPSKVAFFICDQAKIIFLLLEPLYLYTLSNKIAFIGIFNIVLTISSVIYVYVIANKVDIEKKYNYLNWLFVIVLILKLNISNQYLLLIVAFFEGIGIKTNELISTMNMYDFDNKKEMVGYLVCSEIIFCLTRVVILGVVYLCDIALKTTMYILIIGIFMLSFLYKKRDCKSLN